MPDWWGIRVALSDSNNAVTFRTIREPENNPDQCPVSVARLLWRDEALDVLERKGEDAGVRSKSRHVIYDKLAAVLDIGEIKREVWDCLEYSEYRQRLASRLALYDG